MSLFQNQLFKDIFQVIQFIQVLLILEGMAQCGGVLALKSSDNDREEMKNKVIYFMSIDKAKFRNPVRPGDRLDYELEVVK